MNRTIDVHSLRALRGPHRWGRHTAIEAVVTFVDASCPSVDDWRTSLPSLSLASGTQADLLAALCLALQIEAGCPVGLWQTVPAPQPATWFVVIEYSEETVGRCAFEFALRCWRTDGLDTDAELRGMIAELRALDEELRPGPSTAAIMRAASSRGIPWRRLTSGSLVRLGWGSRQRRIQAAETDTTGALAEQVAQDKELTRQRLAGIGLPVPRGRPVHDVADAWEAACEAGLPVVVKPRDGNQGRGVTVGISDITALTAAWHAARAISDDVVVERCLRGRDHRLLVVGERLVAAARRDPPLLEGDGIHSIDQLLDRINGDPRRGDGHGTALTRIPLDDITRATLAAQGWTTTSIPPPGTRVVLRQNANLSTGGTATDVTDDVHPAVARAAISAAREVGLDIAGIDIVCDDISIPLEVQGGGIVEVNAAPGLRMHLYPSHGMARPVGEAIIDFMFPPGRATRIPVVAVTGTNGKTTTVALIAHLLEVAGLRVGKTSTHGVQICGRTIDTGDCSGPGSARKVLAHPDVDAAVLETARGGMLREGLGFDACDVAVVTNIGRGDHLGIAWIETAEALASVKRIVADNVRSETGVAVLNAADPLVVAMADTCPGDVILFASDPHLAVMESQRQAGRRRVFRRGGHVVLEQAGAEHCLSLSEIPLTLKGQLGFQVENVMAAAAAVWALGVAPAVLERGLASFESTARTNPGRFNRFEWRGATLIADYGHNPDALDALVRAVGSLPLPVGARRHVVITAAGDRRDEDIRAQTRILGQWFDRIVLFQDACQRGRADGEVVRLLREGLTNSPGHCVIEEIEGEFKAMDRTLEDVSAGDLCVILVDRVGEAMAHLLGRLQESP